MKTDKIWQRFELLPKDAKQEVINFIKSVENRLAEREKKVASKLNLGDEPFVGIWENRDDQTDSTTFVQEIQKNRLNN